MACNMMRKDYSDIATIFQTAINPLMEEMRGLKTKVDQLTIDRVTRADVEKLRAEIVGSFVPRDSYEPRHAALIERDSQLEALLRELRHDYEVEIEQVNARVDANRQHIDDRLKQVQDVQLSEKDRAWVRWGQALGAVALFVSILVFVIGHIKFF